MRMLCKIGLHRWRLTGLLGVDVGPTEVIIVHHEHCSRCGITREGMWV